MRYKVIMVDIMLTFIGFFFVMATLMTLYFVHLNNIAVVSIYLVLIFPYCFWYGIFKANVIQLGANEL